MLSDVLEKVTRHEIRRLLISFPPRHGKSELVSRIFPAYYLYKNPRGQIGINSYSAELAYGFSRNARDNYSRGGGVLSDEAAAVKEWHTAEGGILWASGVGGPITGRGFTCFLGETLILTEQGSIPISTLVRSQYRGKVLSFNHKTGLCEWRQVIAGMQQYINDGLLEITTKSGCVIRSTKEHRFYVNESGYVQARTLEYGDMLVAAGVMQKTEPSLGKDTIRSVRNLYKPESGSDYSDRGIAVYDIEVEENHNFFAEGILVHNCGIIDDPLKNHVEAASDKIRDKQKQWYQSTFSTREEPNGTVVIIMNRWHESDIVGWLLKQEESEPQGWHVVNFEAIKSEHAIALPPTCTLEPDWRSPGEALCPERYDVEKLLKISKRIGSYFWNSLFQQSPSPVGGGLFKRTWWRTWDYLPRTWDNMCISVDAAFKGNSNSDYVVIQAWGKKGPKYYLLDQIRDRLTFTETEIALVNMINRWPEARARIVEDKANGPAIIDRMSRMIEGIIPWNPGTDSKVSRATAIAPLVEAQNILLPPSASWVDSLIEEFSGFPNGANDDQVDAAVIAVSYLEIRTYDHSWLENI